MLRYTDTTVFNVGTQTIVNTINCVGVMGAGLALEFQLRFPEMEKDYVERCKKKEVTVGRPYLYKNYGNPWILNFPTKHHWKYPSKIEWLEAGLKYFATNYQRGGITSIAFPKLGCSNGGLEWDGVSPLMEKYLQNLDIDIFICLDTEKEATGIEGHMVKLINNHADFSWPEELGIRFDIKKIINYLPIKRFRDLKKIKGVGKQTYNDLFSLLYSIVSNPTFEADKITSVSTSDRINTNLFNMSEDYLKQQPELENQPLTLSCGELELPSFSKTVSSKVDEVDNISTNNSQTASKSDNYDAFYIILPYIEKALYIERTKDEIAEMFKLPKKLVGEWLEEAEKIGKIKKLERPVRYIAQSYLPYKQLECPFVQ